MSQKTWWSTWWRLYDQILNLMTAVKEPGMLTQRARFSTVTDLSTDPPHMLDWQNNDPPPSPVLRPTPLRSDEETPNHRHPSLCRPCARIVWASSSSPAVKQHAGWSEVMPLLTHCTGPAELNDTAWIERILSQRHYDICTLCLVIYRLLCSSSRCPLEGFSCRVNESLYTSFKG